MVEVVSGFGLGLFNTSLSLLGNSGGTGVAQSGQGGDAAYVNAATGNLVIQGLEETLTGQGGELPLYLSYNSQGQLTLGNTNDWQLSADRQVFGLTGTLNTAGSTVSKLFGDGSQVVYTYNTAVGAYVAKDGSLANDTLSWSAAGSTWTWTDGATRGTETYNSAGQLTRSADLSGNATTYSYTGALLTQIKDASGQTVQLTYQGNTLASIEELSQGVTQTRTRYTYDSQNRLTGVTVDLTPADNSVADGATYTTGFSYVGTSLRVASMTHSDGTSVSFSYVQDAQGAYRVASYTDGLGHTTTLGYNLTSHVTTVTDPLGAVTTLTGDASGRLVKVVSPTGVESDYGYDAAGNLASVTVDPSGRDLVTKYTYDANGNQVSSVDAAGDTITRTFSATNRLLTETQYTSPAAGATAAAGALTTTYTYDAADRLRFEVTPEGRVTEYRYDALGNRVTQIEYTGTEFTGTLAGKTDLGSASSVDLSTLTAWATSQASATVQRTDYAYDFRGKLTTQTAYTAAAGEAAPPGGASSVTRYVYDQRGLLIQRIDPRGAASAGTYTTTYTYDGLGRLLTSTRWSAGGTVAAVTNVYNDAAHTVAVTLANGLVTTTTYDANRQVVSVSEASGSTALGTTSYQYDADGHLRRVTDALGNETDYLYNAAGQKTFLIDPTGAVTEYVYDTSGNVVETLAYGTLISRATLLSDGTGAPLVTVDAATLRTAAGGAGSARVSRAVYDGANRLAYTIDGAGDVTAYSYDGLSRLIGTDAYATPVSLSATGGPVTLAGLSALLAAAPASDRVTRRFYGADGLLAGTLDGGGYLTRYFYDGAGNLTETVAYATATGASLRAAGTLAQLTPAGSANDIITYNFYDGEGRRIGQIDGDGYLTVTGYDAAGNVVSVTRYPAPVSWTGTPTLGAVQPATTAGAHITTYTYNELNQVTGETNYEGTTTAYQYDAVGNLVAKTLALATTDQQIYATLYDAQGRIVAELTPQGAALVTAGMTQAQINAIWAQYGTKYTYDAAGHRISATDPLGNRTVYFYDADGRLTLTVDALGEVTETRYNALGQVSDQIRYAQALGPTTAAALSGGIATPLVSAIIAGLTKPATDAHTTYTYDVAGRVASQATTAGDSLTYQYDAFGDVTAQVRAITAGTGVTTSNTYDQRGELVSTIGDAATGGIQATQTRQYDAFGRVISVTNALGQTSATAYDRLGRTVQVTDPLGATKSTTYDAFARVLTSTDALGAVTSYQYNDATRSVTVTSPEGVSLTTTHTRNGQSATISNGSDTYTYAYDANGNLLSRSDTLGTLASNTYDAAGRLTLSVDANGVQTVFVYDAANRVLTKTVDPGTGHLNMVTSYQYDGQGRIVSTTDPQGVVTTTTFDADGREVSQVIDPTGLALTTTFSYDLRGDLTVRTQGAGSANPNTTTYTYDALGRRVSESVSLTTGSSPTVATTTYVYDAQGKLSRKTDALGNSTWYVYDAKGELTYQIDALGDVTQTTYDANGRVISTRQYATVVSTGGFGSAVTAAQITGLLTTSAQDRVTQTVYDAGGRAVYSIDALGDVTQTVYDATGNAVQKIRYATPVASGTYTSAAQVAAALTPNAAADEQIRTAYDARGRIRFTVDALGDVSETRYDGAGNVIETVAYATPITVSGQLGLAAMTGWAASNGTSADHVTRTWYDAAGRVVLVLDAEGYLTQTQHNDAARTQAVTLYATRQTIAAGATTAQALASIVTSGDDRSTLDSYDAGGRLIKTTDALGNTQSYTYDAVGNKLSYTNQNGAIWTYTYDADHHQLTETDPPVDVTSVAPGYLPFGPGGKKIPSGKLAATTTTAVSLVTTMTYDALGNLLSRTEASNTAAPRTTSYVYDALGRQVQTIYPLTNVYSPTSVMADAELQGNSVARVETAVTPETTTVYDALGNAVLNVNNGILNQPGTGDYSYKTYDAMGHVIFAVDALNQVTRYTYDAFGNQTQLTRYANALGASAPAAGTIWTTAQVIAAMTSDGTADPANDRTIVTTYDRLNRAIQIAQASVYSYLPAPGTQSGNGATVLASPTTLYQYDAFGNVIRVRQLVDPTGQAAGYPQYADTYAYYDRRGLKVATVDPGDYLTTTAYNAFADAVRTVQYAQALASAPPLGGAPPAAPSQIGASDRATAYLYDKLNRKSDQIVMGVQVALSGGAINSSTTVEQVTTYQYDKVGNQIAVTDGAGATSYTYYDNLGRVIATAAPARVVDGTAGDPSTILIPLTTYENDAFGNVVSQTVHAAGAATVNSSGYTLANPAPTHTSVVLTYDASFTDFPNTDSVTIAPAGGGSYLIAATRNGDGRSVTASLGSLVDGSYSLTVSGGDQSNTNSYEFTATLTVSAGVATLSAVLPVNLFTVVATNVAAYGTAVPQDRVTLTQRDINGNAIQTMDADGNSTFTSYDIRGHVAKSWQIVTNPNDGTTDALVTIYEYDALGRLTQVLKPQSHAVQTLLQDDFKNQTMFKGAAVSAANQFSEAWATTEFFNINNANGWTFAAGAQYATDGTTANGALMLNESSPSGVAASSSVPLATKTLTGLEVGKQYLVSINYWGDNNSAGLPYFLTGYVNGTQVLVTQGRDAAAGTNSTGHVASFSFTATSTTAVLGLGQISNGLASPIVGSVTVSYQPDTTAADIGVTTTVYNAFGEVAQSGTQTLANQLLAPTAALAVQYTYDQAGRLWRTNAGDGVYKVYQYDLMGNRTAVITSNTVDLSTLSVAAATGNTLPASEQIRTETRYDLLAHAVEQRLPSFTVASPIESINGNLIGGSFNVGTLSYADPGSTTVSAKPTLYWNAPQDSLVMANLATTVSVQIYDSTGAIVLTPTAGVVSAPTLPTSTNPTLIGVDVSSLARGSYTYRVTYSRLGDTQPFYAEATGGFSVGTSIGLITTVQTPVTLTPVTVEWTSNNTDVGYFNYSGPVSGNIAPTTIESYSGTISGLPPGLYSFSAGTLVPNGGGAVATEIQGQFQIKNGVLTVTSQQIMVGPSTGQTVTFVAGQTGGAVISWTAITSPYAPGSRSVDILVNGVWTNYSALLNGLAYSVTLPLASGTYQYRIAETVQQTQFSPPTTQFSLPTAMGSGTLTYNAATNTTIVSDPVLYGSDTFSTSLNNNYATPTYAEAGGARLEWRAPASFVAGSTVTFSYRSPVTSVWVSFQGYATLPVLVDPTYNVVLSSSNLFYADLSGVPAGSIDFEVSYTAPGQSTPYLVDRATTFVGVTSGFLSTEEDTTGLTLLATVATPRTLQLFDRWGDVLSSTDASGNLTSYTYDRLGHVTSVTLPSTEVLSTSAGGVDQIVDQGAIAVTEYNYYDVMGRLTGTRDGNGNLNQSVYNAGGQLLRVYHADGGKLQFAYDIFGDQIQSTDALGYRTRSAYDLNGQLVETAREMGSGGFVDANPANLMFDFYGSSTVPVAATVYAYDAAGRRVSDTLIANPHDDTNGYQTTRYWYDLSGRVRRTQTPLGISATQQFDLFGNKILSTDGNGISQSWSYDAFGHVQSYTDLGGNSTSYYYDAFTGWLSYTNALTYFATNVAKQDVQRYTYDEAGHVLEITDSGGANSLYTNEVAFSRITQYSYDSAGRKAREEVTVNGLVQQDTQTAYDQQNRVVHLSDSQYQDSFRYDAAGNRTLINGTYVDTTGSARSQSLYYTYDAMNRVLISQGDDVNGYVTVDPAQGVALAYDLKGERIGATQYGNPNDYTEASGSATTQATAYITQAYSYDGIGDLVSTTTTDLNPSTNQSVRLSYSYCSYDAAGRKIYDFRSDPLDASGTSQTVYRYTNLVYDIDGRLSSQSTFAYAPNAQGVYPQQYVAESTILYYNDTTGQSPLGFDKAGNLWGFKEIVYNSSGAALYNIVDTLSYQLTGGYQKSSETVTDNKYSLPVTLPLNGLTEYVYNTDNQLVEFVDTVTQANDRFFAVDQNGNTLTAVRGNFTDPGAYGEIATALTTPGPATQAEHFFFARGQSVGSFGVLRDNNGTPTASFDVNYTPVSANYPAQAPAQVVTQTGDSLWIVASRVYGDGSLWYVIAQANGLSDPNQALKVGTILKIPSVVVSVSNGAGVFKPFNGATALGNTTPTQPPAPPPPPPPPPPAPSGGGGGCGVAGTVLLIVAVVAVTVVTAGALAPVGAAIAAGVGEAVGSAAVGTLIAGAAVGAVAAAAGNVAEQGALIASGQQSGFSAGELGQSAVQGGIGGLVSGGVSQISSLDLPAQAGQAAGNALGSEFSSVASAATGSFVTQGVNILDGQQKSFDWSAVGSAALSGVVDGAATAAENYASDAISGLTQQANDAINSAAQQVGDALQSTNAVVNQFASFGSQLINTGISQAVTTLYQGGTFEPQKVLVDSFDNYLSSNLTAATAPYTGTIDQAFGLASQVGAVANALQDPSQLSSLVNLQSIGGQLLSASGISQDTIGQVSDLVNLVQNPSQLSNLVDVPGLQSQLLSSVGISPDTVSQVTDAVSVLQDPSKLSTLLDVPGLASQVLGAAGITSDTVSQVNGLINQASGLVGQVTNTIQNPAQFAGLVDVPGLQSQALNAVGITPDMLQNGTAALGIIQDPTQLSNPANWQALTGNVLGSAGITDSALPGAVGNAAGWIPVVQSFLAPPPGGSLNGGA